MDVLYYIMVFLIAGFIALGSLGKKFSNAQTQREKYLNISVFSLLIAIVMWIVYAFAEEPINGTVILYAAIFGANYVVCNFALYAAMEVESLSKTNLFNSLSLVIPTLTAVIFWQEEFNAWMLVSALILMTASLALIILKKEEGSEEEKTALKKSKIKWLVFNVIAFISNGLSCVIQNAEQRVMEGEGVFSMTALSFSFAAVCALIVYLIYVAATKGETIKADFCALAHNKKSIAFNAVGLGIVNLGVTFLATKVPAAFLYPVALGGSVIIATIFSAVFTKEKMTWRVILGVVLGVAAIVIFSL